MRPIHWAWVLTATLLLSAGLAMACGGGGGDADPTATVAPEATETPEAPEGATQLKLTVEGDFVAPDSHAFSNRFEVAGLSGTRDAVIIGDAAWHREGTNDWIETTRDDPDVVDLIELSSADADFLQDQDFVQNLAALDGEPETINGVDTIRYFIPRETIAALAGLFGGSFVEDTGGLTDFEMTVWLEEDSGGLVRAEFVATGLPALFENDAPFDVDPDAEVAISLTVNLTQINDAEITVEPPIDGATVPEAAGGGDHTFDSFHYTVDVSIAVSEGS